MAIGFRLGDFTFLAPGEIAPIDRSGLRPRRPLRGAEPPRWLQGCVRESQRRGPGRLLWDGQFCGHGEPAYTVFDLHIGGKELFAFGVIEIAGDVATLLARPVGNESWVVLYAAQWFTDNVRPNQPQWIPASMEQEMTIRTIHARVRLSVGLEYPIECVSCSDVSWMTVVAQSEGAEEIMIVADEEMS